MAAILAGGGGQGRKARVWGGQPRSGNTAGLSACLALTARGPQAPASEYKVSLGYPYSLREASLPGGRKRQVRSGLAFVLRSLSEGGRRSRIEPPVMRSVTRPNAARVPLYEVARSEGFELPTLRI